MRPPRRSRGGKTDAEIAGNMAKLLERPPRPPAEVIRGLAAELNVDVVILDPATMTPEGVLAMRHFAELFSWPRPGWAPPSRPTRGLRLVHSNQQAQPANDRRR